MARPKLSEIDLEAPVVTTLRPEAADRAFLATLARRNGISEARVLELGLTVLRRAAELGSEGYVRLQPPRGAEQKDSVRVYLGVDVDLSLGALTVDAFQEAATADAPATEPVEPPGQIEAGASEVTRIPDEPIS